MPEAQEPPHDGLTAEHRALFALFVQWFVSPAGRERVRDALGWSVAEEDARYAGMVPFTRDELSTIRTTVERLGFRRPVSADDADVLNDTRDDLAKNDDELARAIRAQIIDTSCEPDAPVTLERAPPQTPQGDREPVARIADILLDPYRAQVVLPAVIFGFVVGLPLLSHARPFAEDTSISSTWLLILGVGLWAIFSLFALEGLMDWAVRRLRRVPWVLNAEAELDDCIADYLGISGHRKELRRRGMARLSNPLDRNDVALQLVKHDTCQRLAVWMFLAVPLTAFLLRDTTWLRFVYPGMLLMVGAALVSASLDHLRHAARWFRRVGPTGNGASDHRLK